MNRGKYSGDSWALMTPVEGEVEREKRGYKLLEDRTIKCADCGKKLVEVVKVTEQEFKKTIKAICPCGVSSFIYEVLGQTLMQPAEGMIIEDMPTEVDDDNVMHITVKVIKE